MAYEVTFKERGCAWYVYKTLRDSYRAQGMSPSSVSIRQSKVVIPCTDLPRLEDLVKRLHASVRYSVSCI